MLSMAPSIHLERKATAKQGEVVCVQVDGDMPVFGRIKEKGSEGHKIYSQVSCGSSLEIS